MIIWGVTASLFSVMRYEWQFFTLRFALGLAESGAYPGEHHRPQLCAIFSFAEVTPNFLQQCSQQEGIFAHNKAFSTPVVTQKN